MRVLLACLSLSAALDATGSAPGGEAAADKVAFRGSRRGRAARMARANKGGAAAEADEAGDGDGDDEPTPDTARREVHADPTGSRALRAAAYEPDDDPLCPAWAEDGECIRNPQFMWSGCRAACGAQNYVDLEEVRR